MVRDRERRVEEPWFRAGELEIGGAHSPKPKSSTSRRVRSRAYLAHAVTHTVGEDSERLVAYRGKQSITVSKVSVRGVGHYTDHARYFTQHDSVRTTCPRELKARFNQRRSNSAWWAPSPTSIDVARLRVSR